MVPLETGLASQPEFIVDEGDPAEQILQHAAKTGADLIVLGLSSVTKPTTHFQRGVAYRVISKAPCAVLTVR